MDSLTHEEIQDVLNYVMLYTTEKMAHMKITNEGNSLSNDLCTVSAIFEGNCDLALSLCADKLFFVRLAQGIFQSEDVSDQDIEDAAKEYLNVICGRLVNQVSPLIHKPTSFRFPVFQTGEHIFDGDREYSCKSHYVNKNDDGLLLVLALSVLEKEEKHSAKCSLIHKKNTNNIKKE